MKILSLRGENLASLAGRFSLDFTADPLAGAGLFAITGDTGAGKSTLLDALCLALYGEYPRLDFSSSESLLDPSGVSIKASDSRHILRRGAGLGYAEVDFEDRDGKTYRARWEVSRAREKAAGTLKNVKRSLVRLSDGETLADKPKDVSQRVQGLTGLSFDQFRRTSLLAQGHFDAFLAATGNDRAELLERITGTEIYGRISTFVYQGAEQRREGFQLLQAQLQQISRLTDSERALIAISLAELQTQAESASSGIATLDASLGHWDSHTKALSAHQDAVYKGAAAEFAYSARSADRQHLHDLNLVEPIRSIYESAKQAKWTCPLS